MTSRPFVGVDVGGTKVLAVRISERGDVAEAATSPMPGRDASEDELEMAVDAAVQAVLGGGEPAGIGIAAAGLVDRPGERFLFGAHLPWRDAPVRARLADRWSGLGRPRVVLDNDANCAAYGESVLGAAGSAHSALVITLGTGIGGALLLEGRLWRGAHGLAGEFGHMQVVPDGLACECGLRGCWEQYCSGRALERFTEAAQGRHHDGPDITARARAGDELALGAFASVGTWLGVGTAGLVSALDPELVVVGGGLVGAGDLLLTPARTALAGSLQATSYRPVPALLPARLGPEAGAVGAALMARDGRTP